MLVDNTPLETYYVHGVPVLVKREDLCAPYPGPSFSKMRGVYAHILKRPEPVIGVLDTYHSKAGWAVSWTCQALKKLSINFWPRYKADPRTGLPRVQQRMAHNMGAMMLPLQAGRSAVLYHQAKKIMRERWNMEQGESYMMPNALKLPESITENAAEVVRTAPSLPREGTLVISISSGTVASGVLKGFAEVGLLENYEVNLHMGYSRSKEATIKYMSEKSGLDIGAMENIFFIDQKYGYADAAKNVDVPFPCNPYYDAKAWKWLTGYTGDVLSKSPPIVFWNIGS